MKSSILFSAMLAYALPASLVSAQEPAAPAKPAMSMDMAKQMPQMQENMKKMQQQMENIRATTDPTERQKLMQEHMQSMQESMKSMHDMGGPMMMGSGKPGGIAMGEHKNMKAGDMMKQHDMMGNRMDMMQMMMEQMMQYQSAQEMMPK